MFGLSELAVVLIVAIAVLIARKGPELARSAGKSARILKAEARAMKEENRVAAERSPRIIQGATTASSPGVTVPEMRQQPAPQQTERAAGTPPQDDRP
ncbi:twin-arginine translocase TatA/TatE family subunit [Streptomyces marokkonensis]|uniref:twin-arginine translocase TatA/TatE family subunit n=1 Tax=Streptomyces marokkonensis TaxID=324855 RepID=UPI0011F1A620|nr:twin-arginine translocase TatA/TatE family subunit [Streptomyces marokkonensis]